MIFRLRCILDKKKLSKIIRIASKMFFSTSSQNNYKVAVIGASGGIGQPLSLLLKHNPLCTELALYDVDKVTAGVAKDLSHINTSSICKGYVGIDKITKAVYGAHVVVVPAGLSRKPGMTRDDLFKPNANIIYDIAMVLAKCNPCALLAIITNPVNSMVPIASAVMKQNGVYDKSRIFGITTLDLVRASKFVSEINCSDPSDQYVPVVGGHAGATIVPLLSQCDPPVKLNDGDSVNLTKKIQEAGTEVVKAKAGGGSATLSMAFAGARFVDALLRGLSGEPGVVDFAYVRSNVTAAPYFSTAILLGQGGIERNLGLGCPSKYEKKLIENAVSILQKNIKTGIDFVNNKKERC